MCVCVCVCVCMCECVREREEETANYDLFIFQLPIVIPPHSSDFYQFPHCPFRLCPPPNPKARAICLAS